MARIQQSMKQCGYVLFMVMLATYVITNVYHNPVQNFEEYSKYLRLRDLQDHREKQNDSNVDAGCEDDVLPDKYVSIFGTPRKETGFLTIGIPTVRRPMGAQETYLNKTLTLLITNIPVEDRDRIVIVLFLADFDKVYKNAFQEMLSKRFEPYLQTGFMLIMLVDPEAYPKLKSLKRNFGDSEERVSWRAKIVIDFAYMFYATRHYSKYFLQMEDDVISHPNFVYAIEEFIKGQREPWVIISCSKLTSVGRIFHSSDLKHLAKFLKLFYQEMPVDWLYPLFAKLRAQKTIPTRNPSLFDTMGKVSSLVVGGEPVLKWN